ncbi:MAG TPA: saccharopine dehydrogenase C-terminal domain-containing protein [Chitinophagaceae bacterium]|nr:saccharopine dehydrogenase C-terminal domain-containing protein [Chitinophagaceae bacterium]
MTIAVLGAGMVGRAIALDLAKEHMVTSFDLSEKSLDILKKRNIAIRTVVADLTNYTKYPEWLSPYDLVVTAVPGFMGYKTLEAVIKAGKDTADISFFPENALKLDQLAKEKNVTVITDCGVAPGMSNLILGRHNAEIKIDSFACYVGGLPKHPQPPFNYKAPFSPIDVIEEYTRPARLVENGKVITKPALSDREILDFEKAGKLEAFNTDGLRSLLFTMTHIPEMKEKTLRYPGHADLIQSLQKAGFFETSPIKINDSKISPLDFTSGILLKEWKLDEDEKEFTIMKVIIKGENKTIEYNLYDEYDAASRTSSMARTTGYTCTAAVHLITNGLFNERGVFPPELIGAQKNCFEFVLNYLDERGVKWRSNL